MPTQSKYPNTKWWFLRWSLVKWLDLWLALTGGYSVKIDSLTLGVSRNSAFLKYPLEGEEESAKRFISTCSLGMHSRPENKGQRCWGLLKACCADISKEFQRPSFLISILHLYEYYGCLQNQGGLSMWCTSCQAFRQFDFYQGYYQHAAHLQQHEATFLRGFKGVLSHCRQPAILSQSKTRTFPKMPLECNHPYLGAPPQRPGASSCSQAMLLCECRCELREPRGEWPTHPNQRSTLKVGVRNLWCISSSHLIRARLRYHQHPLKWQDLIHGHGKNTKPKMMAI